jgi:hypothetical protein
MLLVRDNYFKKVALTFAFFEIKNPTGFLKPVGSGL